MYSYVAVLSILNTGRNCNSHMDFSTGWKRRRTSYRERDIYVDAKGNRTTCERYRPATWWRQSPPRPWAAWGVVDSTLPIFRKNCQSNCGMWVHTCFLPNRDCTQQG